MLVRRAADHDAQGRSCVKASQRLWLIPPDNVANIRC
jgi:hypothetical protein